MTITTTSKLAYKQINEDGTSMNQKDVIMEAIESYCNMEYYDGKGVSLQEIRVLTGIEINAVSGRVNDLKRDERLKTTEKRKCSVTNRLVSPVVVMSEDTAFEKEEEDKLELLLRLYGYEHYKIIDDNDKKGQRVLKLSGLQQIHLDDLANIHKNCNLHLDSVRYWDEDCGYRYWYELK